MNVMKNEESKTLLKLSLPLTRFELTTVNNKLTFSYFY